ncbi:MAG: phosphoribosyltransferase [Actinomycetia bacterium]|nr:phosphoribosyltransferase [Actinomycetes bacterium]MCP4959946.1 phosphoribosyltransferase [Actinomycetes bacterium]
MVFYDRADAGGRLARRVIDLVDGPVVVLGLPRGGVPVAAEVAAALDAPLDVIIVRKVGTPHNRELAMGAVGEDGARYVNAEVVRTYAVSRDQYEAAEQHELEELERRSVRLRAVRPRVDLEDRTAVVVDDGLATGATARAACQVARAHGAARVVLAVPVAPRGAAAEMSDVADLVIVAETPRSFFGVGQFYDDFSQTADDEVVELLSQNLDR